MTISRDYLTINSAQGKRCVHYRRAAKGPPLLMVHQSLRPAAEYAPLMRQWAERFTCIAPDTPGFGRTLTQAWGKVRASHLYAPRYAASKDNAIPTSKALPVARLSGKVK